MNENEEFVWRAEIILDREGVEDTLQWLVEQGYIEEAEELITAYKLHCDVEIKWPT